MMWLDLCQMLQSLYEISGFSKHVLPFLRRCVGHLGKCTKACHISEKLVIKGTQITAEYLSLCHQLCRMTHDLRYP